MIYPSTFWRRLLDQLWLIGFVALPLIFAPLRYESYESPRAMIAMLLGVGIILAALPVHFLSSPGVEGSGVRAAHSINWRAMLGQPLVLAVVLWAMCILLSAIFSLSPARSIFGDLQRRIGALTQLSLIAAFVGGAMVTRWMRARCWPLLTITAVIITGYAVLQRVGLSPFVPGWNIRPSGTIGAPAFAGTWAVTALLWLVVAVIAGSTRHRRLHLTGIFALLLLLVLGQARGALLGLGAGGVTLAVIWLVFQGKRRLAGLIIAGAVAILALVVAIYVGVVRIEQVSGRLRASEDRSGQVRLELWRTTAQLVREWPIMIAANGEGDGLGRFRPFLGYGQEMYEVVERLYIDDAVRATYPETEFVDRAHNLWLDTLVTQGVVGLAGLISVYAAAAVTCVRILSGRPHPLAPSPNSSGADRGIYLTPKPPLRIQRGGVNQTKITLPVRPSTPNYGEGASIRNVSERQWIAAAALAIVVAHVVDLQFSFPSVVGEWPFWATLGVLCGIGARRASSRRWAEARFDRTATMMLPLFAWIMTWGLASLMPHPPEQVVLSALCVGLAACGLALIVWHLARRAYLRVIIASALAALIQYVMSALMVATPDRLAFLLLADHAIFVTVLFALAVHNLRMPASLNGRGTWARAGIALIVGIFIVIDATADSLLAISGRMPQAARHAIYATAVTFKAHDDRLFQLAGQGTTDLVLAGSVARTQAMEAQGWLERSAELDPYDPHTTILRARLAIALALITQERNHLEAADRWFALATNQWPNQPMLWLEWAQFVLNLRQEPARAIQLAERAQQLTRTAPGSDRLIGNANRILSRNLEAAQAYRIALKVDPKDSASAIALSQILTENSDLRAARTILIRALQRATITLKRIQILSTLALVIEKQGEPWLALRYVDSALSVASNPVDRSRLMEMRTRLRRKIQSR